MLIEFKVENFRSFRESQTLSMVAATFSEHQETNTFDPGLPGGFERLLRSATVYGPNAGGKTNLLRALQTMQSFIVHSATLPKNTPPPYAPFKLSDEAQTEPVDFCVSFVQGEIRYEYGFSIDAVRVRKEWLIEYVNARGRTLFERQYMNREKKYSWKFSSYLKGQRASWSENTREESLFLSTAVQLNSKQLLPAFEWFQKRLVILLGPVTLNKSLTLEMLRTVDGRAQILPFLKEADLGITDFIVMREPITPGSPPFNMSDPATVAIEHIPGEPFPSMVKVAFSHKGTEDKPVRLDYSEESSGTQLFFIRSGAWLKVLNKGEVLLVDELESSLHPLLVKFLIARFHSSRTNPNNAQLIFSTHNTSLLDKEIFRRDQIWFVEKGADGSSRLYPLTDFKPRNAEALERGYMRGKYGAIPILSSMGE